ncbi:ParA family protein [Desulfovibrio inopinatus]|uniref:ParA family protein n=1 Tax=Desulfovibrio inopinatus TaxID=102109 RepID=UPI00042646FE|nr:ParA family protein [Desulfovibrio inopinatus]
MYITSIANQKGGVGKTTTTTNLSYNLSRRKKKVLVIDCDPQGNASQTLSKVSPFELEKNIGMLFSDGATFSSCAVPCKYEGIHLIPNNLNAGSITLSVDYNDPMRFIGFRTALERDIDFMKTFDYVLIDCPPQIDSLFLNNALVVSDFYIIPVEAGSAYALSGVDALLRVVNKIVAVNPKLKLLGALLTLLDKRTKAGKIIANSVKAYFQPENVFKTQIHRNTVIERSNIAGRCICDFDESALGCRNYRDLATEFMDRIESFNG